jgi:myosin-crossreactive antigen
MHAMARKFCGNSAVTCDSILRPLKQPTAFLAECLISPACSCPARGDRPLPVPRESGNLAFISQFVEIADDVVFTVEYSVRAAQMAVYELLDIDRKIPAVTPHAKSLQVQFKALMKAFK